MGHCERDPFLAYRPGSCRGQKQREQVLRPVAGRFSRGKKKDKKILTSGKIDYSWKFHEKSEKAYTKAVTTTADGNLTKGTDMTNASFKNANDRVINTATVDNSNKETSKVYKGKSASLLQKKADTKETTTETTSDVGYDRLKYSSTSGQTGKVGFGNKKETGTYTNQEGANTLSTIEM